MENEILILMLIICLLIIYLYQNYVETTLNNLKENLKIIDADEIDVNDKYKYNKIYRKNICIDKDEFINGKDKINNKIYREVKKTPKSILKNKDVPKRKSNKKVEIIDNDSCSIGDLLNNGNDMMSLNGIDNTLSDVEFFIN